MYGHRCSQAILAFATKAGVLSTKSHMLNFCEACAAICCYCDLWEPITQDTKRFSVPRKKRARLKTKNITTFGKALFVNQYWMRYVIHILPNTKDLAINLATDGCLWKPAKRNSVCMSKQLWFVASTETFNGNQALFKLSFVQLPVFLFKLSFAQLPVFRSSCRLPNCQFFVQAVICPTASFSFKLSFVIQTVILSLCMFRDRKTCWKTSSAYHQKLSYWHKLGIFVLLTMSNLVRQHCACVLWWMEADFFSAFYEFRSSCCMMIGPHIRFLKMLAFLLDQTYAKLVLHQSA